VLVIGLGVGTLGFVPSYSFSEKDFYPLRRDFAEGLAVLAQQPFDRSG
jgi:hypothetical protein